MFKMYLSLAIGLTSQLAPCSSLGTSPGAGGGGGGGGEVGALGALDGGMGGATTGACPADASPPPSFAAACGPAALCDADADCAALEGTYCQVASCVSPAGCLRGWCAPVPAGADAGAALAP